MTTSAPIKSSDDCERLSDDCERLSLYAPEGTKAMIEHYRRRKGFRSRNEAVMHIINAEINSEVKL